jgi:hypothetical protein
LPCFASPRIASTCVVLLFIALNRIASYRITLFHITSHLLSFPCFFSSPCFAFDHSVLHCIISCGLAWSRVTSRYIAMLLAASIYSISHFITLPSIASPCITSPCIVLHHPAFIILHFITLNRFTTRCLVFPCFISHHLSSTCIAFHCSTLRPFVSHRITSHFIAFHRWPP